MISIRATLHGLGILGISLTQACVGEKKAPDTPPNIILILADDLGYGDLGCYGQTLIKTPNIDRLAQRGIRFTQHYSGSTVCAPSRNCLLTGETTGRCTIRGNGYGDTRIPLEEKDTTLASRLKNAGYHTAIFGKWGLGEPGSGSEPGDKGFDEWLGYLNQKHAHYHSTDSLYNLNGKVLFEDGKVYTPDLFTARALDLIREKKDQPFFIFLSYTLPHAELFAPEKWMKHFEYNFEEVPFEGSEIYPFNPAPRASYATMVSLVDLYVGEITTLLDSLDLSEETILIFTSDNGPEAGGKHGCDPDFFNSTGSLRGVKRSLYEGGIRVPLIMSWPGEIPEGKTQSTPSGSWDLLPYLCEIAGAAVPTTSSGNARRLMLNNPSDVGTMLYWEFIHPARGPAIAVRSGNDKALFFLNEMRTELYDLETDKGETRDLSAQKPEMVKELLEKAILHRSPSAYWDIDSEELFRLVNQTESLIP